MSYLSKIECYLEAKVKLYFHTPPSYWFWAFLINFPFLPPFLEFQIIRFVIRELIWAFFCFVHFPILPPPPQLPAAYAFILHGKVDLLKAAIAVGFDVNEATVEVCVG